MERESPKYDETAIREAWSRGDFHAAVTETLRQYGPEVFGFLIGSLRAEHDAEEAFSMMAERLWQGMARFEWRCAMRTWVYLLARHASVDLRGAPHRRAGRAVPLSQVNDVSALLQRARTATQSYLRTERRDAILELRDGLSAEDRALLILRVDRGLPWRDVARVFTDDSSADRGPALEQEAARLRKRFQLIKAQLKARAARRDGH